MAQLDWRDFGAQPGGIVDCTAAINDSFQVAIANGMESHGPAGVYKITGPLVWNDPYPRISGEGGRTIIEPDDTDYDWLTVGTGSTVALGPAGWVRDLTLKGAVETTAPSGFNAGLKLSAGNYIDVRNVWVRFAPIGFDLINNSFGTSYTNCRTVFDECRIGILLRGSFGSGNDLPFYNCWFAGREAAVWMEGNGGGYHFHGGQLLGGVGASVADDNRGIVVVGKTLETGVVEGQCSGTFLAVSFESVSYGHGVRVFNTGGGQNGAQLLFHGCNFVAGTEPISVLKISNGYDDTIIFDMCSARGAFSADKPVDFGTNLSTGRPYYFESGSFGRCTFNGVFYDLRSDPMFKISQVIRGVMLSNVDILTNGLLLRNDGGMLKKSDDWGITYTNVP
jgi:hypothetical protein